VDPSGATAGSIESEPFGHVDGQEVRRFVLTNAAGSVAKVSELGATLASLWLPDRDGKMDDVVLGFESQEPSLAAGSPYFGVTAGRVANRIMDARCEFQGRTLELAANDDPHHLHGGARGFDKRVFRGVALSEPGVQRAELRYTSPAGEEGYPGELEVVVRYSLRDDNALRIEMEATTSEPTLVNMAHHSYWNLDGHDSGGIEGHELKLHAARYTPGEPVPDGRIFEVEGTPYDFTAGKCIGDDLERGGASPIGFDHNWVVDGEPHELRPVAELRSVRSGRVLRLEANQPGVQFYSGNFLDGTARGKQGAVYRRHAGLCLETQAHPNSPNVPAWQPDVLLSPGESYRHVMIHRFSIKG
jgi:aldose 1-epimerase